MPYGTVKVDNVTFTNNSVDATTTFSGIYASITDNLTLSGTATATTFTGTTANFTNVNAQNIGVTTSLSGLAITGGTAGFTTITGTTVTGTTANFVTVSGTTVTGNTGQFTNLAGAAAGFTTVTGTTVTGTTANFVSGVFTTRISGTTVTGTTASFTSGVFASLSGTTHTITSGVFALGTAALPSISFVSDPNTGIYSPGADQVAVATNGTGRLFVDASGNVGVGLTPASYAGYSVIGHGSTTGATLEQRVSGILVGSLTTDSQVTLKAITAIPIVFSTNNTERARIDSSGRLGIGTSAPGSRLEIGGDASYDATITFNRVPAHTSNDGVIGELFFQNNADSVALIAVKRESAADDAYIQFATQQTTGGLSEKVRITSAGLVGIGTSSPGQQLDVNGEIVCSPNTAGKNTFQFTTQAADDASLVMRANTTIKVNIQANGTSYFNGGNVGIGTSSPTTRFHVDFGDAADNSIRLVGDGATNGTALATNWFTGLSYFDVRLGGNTTSETKLRVTSAGLVGIGTTAPQSLLDASSSTGTRIRSTYTATGGGRDAGFEIFGDGAANSSFVYAGNTGVTTISSLLGTALNIGGTEALRVDSSRRLLIGTSDGSGGVSKLVVQGASNGSAVGVAQISYNGLSSAVLAADTDIGYLRFTDQGSNSGVFAQITASTDGTTGASDYPGRLVFSTTADGSAVSDGADEDYLNWPSASGWCWHHLQR
jgi:hypothetical protein